MEYRKDVSQTTNGELEMLEIYYWEIGKSKLYTPDQEADLATKAINGDSNARTKLYTSNLRYVVKVVSRYWRGGISKWELIQAGNQALERACKTFDPTRGFKLISYADKFIAGAVKKAIKDFKSKELPSIDSPCSQDPEQTMQDHIENENTDRPDKITLAETDQAKTILTSTMFEAISDRDAQILMHYYGLNANQLTVEEIAEKMKLDASTVTKLKKASLIFLRYKFGSAFQKLY